MKAPEQINIHQAKTRLPHLVDQVAQGAEIVVAKAGKPLARLVPLEPAATARTPGLLKGRIRIADDFDETLPQELLDVFKG